MRERPERRLLVIRRPELWDACLVVFTADVVAGIVSPTFSLYARSLGGPLVLIGILTATAGAARLLLSVPLGAFSDRHRKLVIVGGMVFFGTACLGFASVKSAYLLLPSNLLFGIAQVATFSLGVAYLGDHLPEYQRGLGISLYTTAMGLGFGIGPAIGVWMTGLAGFRSSYLLAGALAGGGALYAALRLRGETKIRRVRRADHASMRSLFRDPRIYAACISSALASLSFNAAIVTFLPVMAREVDGLAAGVVGAIFSIRAFISTGVRLPTGLMEALVPIRWLITGALLLEAASLVGLILAHSEGILIGILSIEGVSFGALLTAGQEFMSRTVHPAQRGLAMGIYSWAGSLATVVGGFVLGLMAQFAGLSVVFIVSAVAIAVGIFVFVPLSGRSAAAVKEAVSA